MESTHNNLGSDSEANEAGQGSHSDSLGSLGSLAGLDSLESQSRSDPEPKQCWFYHRGRCHNDPCKFVHDPYLRTPEGAAALRLETMARQRVVKAIRRANSRLSDAPCSPEEEEQLQLQHAANEPVRATEPEKPAAPKEPRKPKEPKEPRRPRKRLSLCPWGSEADCRWPGCRLLHASKYYYYRPVIAQ